MKDGIESNSKEITDIVIKRMDGSLLSPSELIIELSNDSVHVQLPAGTDRSQLSIDVTHTGISIDPLPATIRDFSSPIIFTITAEDKSIKKYVLNLTVPNQNKLLIIGVSNNKLHALNAVTGKLVWTFTGEGSFAYSSPTYHDGIVYVGCIDSYVYAIDAENGVMKWKYKAGDTGIESDAVLVDNTVYVGSNDDHMYALNAANGSLKWKYKTGANISSSPIINSGKVYFGSSDNNFYALDAASGNLVWKYATNGMINQSGATLANGILYFGSRDQSLYALHAIDGSLKWKYTTPVSLEASSPSVENGVVYAAGWYDVPSFSIKGSLYALDAATGTLLWESGKEIAYSSSPFVKDNIVYITGDNLNIMAFATTNGNLLWEKKILPNSSSPLVSEGIVYVGGGGSWHIYALKASSGDEVWKFPIPGSLMTSSPLLIIDQTPVHSGDNGTKT